MKILTRRQYCPSRRNFSASRVAYWHSACCMASLVVIRSPKLRLQTICCFAGGISSRGMQDSPLSSRTVRSSTTLKFLRMKVGEVRARSRAVFIPNRLRRLPILEPTPQVLLPADEPAWLQYGLGYQVLMPARHGMRPLFTGPLG